MTDDTSVKPRIKNKSGRALRQGVRALRALSGKRSKSQRRSTGALTPITLLQRTDGAIDELAYWSFVKGHSTRGKAEQLLLVVPDLFTTCEKQFLRSIATWRRPATIPLKHREKVDRLYSAVMDVE